MQYQSHCSIYIDSTGRGGTYGDYAFAYFDGSLTEFNFFDVPITASEAQALASIGPPIDTCSQAPVLKAHYPLVENSQDYAGNFHG